MEAKTKNGGCLHRLSVHPPRTDWSLDYGEESMDQLSKLSLKELLELNSAVQEELAKRIQNLTDENVKRIH